MGVAGKMATPRHVISLYRRLLREGRNFTNYNYREYTSHRVRDYFKNRKSLIDPQAVNKEYQYGLDMLALIKRQVAISQMYTDTKIVIEDLTQT